jgi:Fur family peroxide stress response transcriptional regulator
VRSQSRFEELVSRFKEEEYRLTPQRIAVLRILADSDRHPSAAQLYEQVKDQFPTTSLATIYKTLYVLKDMGEVREYGFSDDDNRYDAKNPEPHPHLICVNCQEIVDAPVTMVEDFAGEVARRTGYDVVSQRLDFYGVCQKCQRSDADALGQYQGPGVGEARRKGSRSIDQP